MKKTWLVGAALTVSLVAGSANALTTKYYFINDSEKNISVQWNHGTVVYTAKPWEKVALGQDSNKSGHYTLAISDQANNLQQAPLQLSFTLDPAYSDHVDVTKLEATGQQNFSLTPQDEYKPSSLTRSVNQVRLRGSDAFTLWGNEYHLYQSDIEYNNFLKPTREVDFTLHQTIHHYQRNDNDPNQLDVLSYNVQLWDDFSALGGMRLNRATRRSQLIPQRIGHYDVVIAEELMSEDNLQGRRKQFVAGMKAAGYPYSYGPIPKDSFLGVSSGVMIFSHWPISHQDKSEYPFRDENGVDDLSAKGALYVQINKQGKMYHLFATHTQADEPNDTHSKDVAARDRQFQDLFTFIRSKNLSAATPVIVAGDLNVDYQNCYINKDCAEYQVTIDQLTHKSQAWDNLDLMPYGSNSAINLMNTDSTPEMVDYVLMLGQPLMATAPEFTKHSRIRVIRAPDVAEMYAGGSSLNSTKTPFAELDLSDHFAFESEFHLTK